MPGHDRSAGKQHSGKTRKGSRWLNAALKDAAMAAIRTNNSYPRALYERQRSRIGHGKAIGAVKHSIIVAAWHMLTNGELYTDLGPDYYRRRDPARTTKRLVAQLQALGHTVTLQQAAA
jgi:transposase